LKKLPRAAAATVKVKVRVTYHDHRVVAAEFELDTGEVPPAELTDRLSRLRRSGERDRLYFRVGDQRGTDVRAAGKDMQHAGGQPRLLEDPGEDDSSGDRRTRVGLEDHRIAERQSMMCRGQSGPREMSSLSFFDERRVLVVTPVNGHIFGQPGRKGSEAILSCWGMLAFAKCLSRAFPRPAWRGVSGTPAQ
jgi:hypothetical protein